MDFEGGGTVGYRLGEFDKGSRVSRDYASSSRLHNGRRITDNITNRLRCCNLRFFAFGLQEGY